MKKIVIGALLVINVFFLTIFLWNICRDHTLNTEALQDISALLQQNGIYIDTDNIREGDALSVLEIRRDRVAERSLADALLGDTQETDQGGGIYNYVGNNGQAEFGNGGELDITFYTALDERTVSAENTAKGLLKTMNIETISVEASGEPGNETVTAVCSWDNQPIFNCRIAFIFKDGSLSHIKGNYAAIIEVTANKTDMDSAATALMHFLSDIKSGKYSCTQITKVEPGYRVNELGDTINAAWRIETDNGVYYYDAVTSALEQDVR